MHGGLPADFPKEDMIRFISIDHVGHVSGDAAEDDAKELHDLEEKIRNWPRSEDNDPYYAGSMELKEALESVLDYPVILAFNEFCAPSIEDAIVQGVDQYAVKEVLMVTAMTTAGGAHSEKDIPEAIARARKLVRDEVSIKYIWPIPVSETAQFLSERICELK